MRCSTKTSRARFTDGLKGTRRQRPPVAGVPLNNASFDPVFIPRLCQNVERACVIHGGEEHVTGTVTSISDTSVTVKTTAGKAVEVGFDAKTTYARAKQPIQKTDIKVGDRVVIHAMVMNEKLVAHTVEIGAATPAKEAVKH